MLSASPVAQQALFESADTWTLLNLAVAAILKRCVFACPAFRVPIPPWWIEVHYVTGSCRFPCVCVCVCVRVCALLLRTCAIVPSGRISLGQTVWG